MYGTFAIHKRYLKPDPEKPGFFNAFIPGKGVVSQNPDGNVTFAPEGSHGAWEEFFIREKEAIFPDVDGLTYIIPYRE